MAMYGFDWRVLHFTTQPSAVILSHSQLQLPKHIKLLEAACSFLHNDISAVSKIYAFICMPQDQGSRIIDICIIHTYMHHTHIHQDQESLIYASIHTCIINTGVIDTCIVDTCRYMHKRKLLYASPHPEISNPIHPSTYSLRYGVFEP